MDREVDRDEQVVGGYGEEVVNGNGKMVVALMGDNELIAIDGTSWCETPDYIHHVEGSP